MGHRVARGWGESPEVKGLEGCDVLGFGHVRHLNVHGLVAVAFSEGLSGCEGLVGSRSLEGCRVLGSWVL